MNEADTDAIDNVSFEFTEYKKATRDNNRSYSLVGLCRVHL